MSSVGMEIRSVEVDGQLLRVGIRPGSGVTPPLLIFNGIGANLELVEPFVAALEGVETIIFDVPGVGGSPLPPRPYRLSHLARMAAGLLAKLGYEGQVDVIGVSWGGALAQEFAHLYPDRCRRLILASTSPGAIMMPGRLSALAKLISPRRYSDPEFLHAVGGELYGGAYRRNPELLRLVLDDHPGCAETAHRVGITAGRPHEIWVFREASGAIICLPIALRGEFDRSVKRCRATPARQSRAASCLHNR